MEPTRAKQAAAAFAILVAVALSALMAGVKAREFKERADRLYRAGAAGTGEAALAPALGPSPIKPKNAPRRRLPPASAAVSAPVAAPLKDPAPAPAPAPVTAPAPAPATPAAGDETAAAPARPAPPKSPAVPPADLPYLEACAARSLDVAALEPLFSAPGAKPLGFIDLDHYERHRDDNPPLVALFQTVDLERKYGRREGGAVPTGAPGPDAPPGASHPAEPGIAPAPVRIHAASNEVLVLWDGECRVIPKALLGKRYVIGADPAAESAAQPLLLMGRYFVGSCESPQHVFLLTTDSIILYRKETGDVTAQALDSRLVRPGEHRMEHAGGSLHFVGPRDYVRYDLRERRFTRAEYRSIIDHAGFSMLALGIEEGQGGFRAFASTPIHGLYLLEPTGHVANTHELEIAGTKIALNQRPIGLIAQGPRKLYFSVAAREGAREEALLFSIGAPPERRVETIGNPVEDVREYFALAPTERGGLLALHDRGLSLLVVGKVSARWEDRPAPGVIAIAADRSFAYTLDAAGALERVSLEEFMPPLDGAEGDGSGKHDGK